MDATIQGLKRKAEEEAERAIKKCKDMHAAAKEAKDKKDAIWEAQLLGVPEDIARAKAEAKEAQEAFEKVKPEPPEKRINKKAWSLENACVQHSRRSGW